MSARSMRENGFSSPNGPPSCVQSRRGDPNLQSRAAILRGMGQKMWCNIKASLCGPDALLPKKPGQASVRLSQRLAPHTKSGERGGGIVSIHPAGEKVWDSVFDAEQAGAILAHEGFFSRRQPLAGQFLTGSPAQFLAGVGAAQNWEDLVQPFEIHETRKPLLRWRRGNPV